MWLKRVLFRLHRSSVPRRWSPQCVQLSLIDSFDAASPLLQQLFGEDSWTWLYLNVVGRTIQAAARRYHRRHQSPVAFLPPSPSRSNVEICARAVPVICYETFSLTWICWQVSADWHMQWSLCDHSWWLTWQYERQGLHLTGNEDSVKQVWPLSGLVNMLLQSSSFLNITVNNLLEIAGKNYWRRRNFLTQFISTGFDVVQ